MLDFLGEPDTAERIRKATDAVTDPNGGTVAVGDAIAARVRD